MRKMGCDYILLMILFLNFTTWKALKIEVIELLAQILPSYSEITEIKDHRRDTRMGMDKCGGWIRTH